MKTYLVLEDGTLFEGKWKCGKDSVGEVIFNTAHGGYEEIATDPSYYGQIIVMSASQQGNYGVDSSFWESRQLWIRGFIALDIQESENDSHWLELLKKFSIPAMDGLDTRSLILLLRERGTQVGAMVEEKNREQARKKAINLIDKFKREERDWTFKVTCRQTRSVRGQNRKGPRVAVLDFGCKENTLRELAKKSSEIMVFPSRASVEQILEWNPDGVLLSNGPGDPRDVKIGVQTISQLLGKKPLFGICMGHQLLALALGGKIYKLKFGHHGVNHPVKELKNQKIYITSQNHGYAVEDQSLPPEVEITHINLNDQTVSGIRSPAHNCFSVQFHPESHPGPRDGREVFDQFFEQMSKRS